MSGNSLHHSDNKSDLFNPSAYVPLALLFTFVLPGVLFALNVGRTRTAKSRNLLLILFGVLGGLLLAASLAFPNRLGRSAILELTAIDGVVGGLLWTIQLPTYRARKSVGAGSRSLRTPILIAIAAVFVVAAPTVVSDLIDVGREAVLQFEDHGNRISYAASISPDDVQKIAFQLRQAKVFSDDTAFQFDLRSVDQKYRLTIPIKKDAFAKPETNDFLTQLASFINENAGLKNVLEVEAAAGQE